MKTISNFSITGSTLKIIAMLLMILDHIGAVILEGGLLRSNLVTSSPELLLQVERLDYILRMIGRPSFPIFCFLLVEGFLHTRNVKKYALRLFLFALISEIPFNLALFGRFFDFGMQNIYFTLLIGLLVMAGLNRFREKPPLQILFCIAGLFGGYFLQVDYGYLGVLLIMMLYLFRLNKPMQAAAGSVCVLYEPTAIAAFLPIWFYHGERGRSLKYFFYWFYPAHLLLFAVIAQYLAKL